MKSALDKKRSAVKSGFSAKRRAIIAGRPENFKRGHKAGLYAKGGTAVGVRRVPANFEMYALEAVGHRGYSGIHCG